MGTEGFAPCTAATAAPRPTAMTIDSANRKFVLTFDRYLASTRPPRTAIDLSSAIDAGHPGSYSGSAGAKLHLGLPSDFPAIVNGNNYFVRYRTLDLPANRRLEGLFGHDVPQFCVGVEAGNESDSFALSLRLTSAPPHFLLRAVRRARARGPADGGVRRCAGDP